MRSSRNASLISVSIPGAHEPAVWATMVVRVQALVRVHMRKYAGEHRWAIEWVR